MMASCEADAAPAASLRRNVQTPCNGGSDPASADQAPRNAPDKETAMTTVRTEFQVRGMHCAACTRHVDRALRDIRGVSAIDVRLREEQVVIEHDPTVASIETLIDAVRDA